jgi:pimeloyl-ACP methyl ester carboxylesterase
LQILLDEVGMPTIDANGCSVYFETRGEGEPLLLLHGGMGVGADWLRVFPIEPPGFRLIVPDLRGHGRSTNPSREFTFRQFALDAYAVLGHLGVARTKAVGVSAGAKTLLHMATQQPDRIEAMVLASATPRFPPQVRPMMEQMTADSLSETEWAALRQRHVHGDAQIRLLYEMVRGFATSYDDMSFTPSTLATITARTLVVHGDRDPLYPVDMALELYRGIPKSALWVIPYGDHGSVWADRASEFASASLAHVGARGHGD